MGEGVYRDLLALLADAGLQRAAPGELRERRGILTLDPDSRYRSDSMTSPESDIALRTLARSSLSVTVSLYFAVMDDINTVSIKPDFFLNCVACNKLINI